MHGLIGNGCQKLGDVINQYTIHGTLHQAEQVMIVALHLNYLVDYEENNLTCLRFHISYNGIEYASMLQSHFGIISKDIH